ncbi:HEAT repeat domain-containing protein [Streptacidiphilus sp. N1-10]|uniref:HEAT repeat domain-containing protein n=1 Tax=Streptacidiphilus jeojiensis TaxID=3229225 RepID=A0ABV6XYK1_9ACTN
MEESIDDLLEMLDADRSELAEDAQHALIALGSQVVEPLIAVVPRLGRFGQLCAIEVFNSLGDMRPAEVLVGLLTSEDTTVRSWSAEALGDLGARRAAPALRQAYEAWKMRAEPLGDSEAGCLRWALTQLGARERVLPPRVAELQTGGEGPGSFWRADDLVEVINELAEHQQAVLGFLIWRTRRDGGLSWVSGPDLDWEVDRALPWARTVAECRDWALLAAGEFTGEMDLAAMIDWIDSSDT